MSYRLGENTKVTAGIIPVAQSAGAVNGLVIDRFGFFDAIAHLKLGAVAGSPTALGVSVKMQTGDAADGSDMADVAADLTLPLTTALAEAKLNLDLNSYKRYLRPVLTTTFTGGTTPTIPVAITIILGNAVSIPV